jgi:hypothetical protein
MEFHLQLVVVVMADLVVVELMEVEDLVPQDLEIVHQLHRRKEILVGQEHQKDHQIMGKQVAVVLVVLVEMVLQQLLEMVVLDHQSQ